MSLGQFIFVFSSPGNFLADSSICVDSSTVESVILHMADAFITVTWGNAKGLEGGKECLSFPVENF